MHEYDHIYVSLYTTGARVLSQLAAMRAQLKDEDKRVTNNLEREKVKYVQNTHKNIVVIRSILLIFGFEKCPLEK